MPSGKLNRVDGAVTSPRGLLDWIRALKLSRVLIHAVDHPARPSLVGSGAIKQGVEEVRC